MGGQKTTVLQYNVGSHHYSNTGVIKSVSSQLYDHNDVLALPYSEHCESSQYSLLHYIAPRCLDVIVTFLWFYSHYSVMALDHDVIISHITVVSVYLCPVALQFEFKYSFEAIYFGSSRD